MQLNYRDTNRNLYAMSSNFIISLILGFGKGDREQKLTML